MNWVSIVCFSLCLIMFLSTLRRDADLLSPARLFGFIWSLSIGLTELKFSALQHTWQVESWALLLIGVGAFLIGVFTTYVLNVGRQLVPISVMRRLLRKEEVHEGRLFWLILLSTLVYGSSYVANFLVRGWLPVDAIGTSTSRVDFNVSGLTLFLYTATFIIYFSLLYFFKVQGKTARKVVLASTVLASFGTFVLLLMRYPIILVSVMSFSFLYYATNQIRLRTAIPILAAVTGFFYWISSLRFSTVISTYLYSVSKMRFSKDYAIFTEPYMYFVTNLENFARSVSVSDYHTYGYFTFDFITALAGLKYWVLDYFDFDRTPYLTSNYNTYTAFWWFYSDFGVVGLAVIPLILGICIGMLYYRMRISPSTKNVTAYGVMVFVMFISYFNFPFAFLWFEYVMLALFLFLRWVVLPKPKFLELGGK
jgi:oligosaccharide repeat unit polymerase